METKEEAEGHEDQSQSTIWELDHGFEEEAVKVDGGVQNPVHSGSTASPRLLPLGHRRTQSEFTTAGHKRTNSFQRLKTQMQRAWRWGGNSRDERYRPSFNPEVLANQKRQWYQLHSKSMDRIKYEHPKSIFEHFIIVGIHPDASLGEMEKDFAKRKKWEMEMKKSGIIDLKIIQHHGPPLPTFEPQLLFRYPPGKRIPMRLKDLANFCFPGGVKGRLLERTPSFSDLNELLYGQVAGNVTVYGVCLHIPELVQRQPGILDGTSPIPTSTGACSQLMVSAPRCYCLLTRVPFFELHYEMLNSIIAQERLNRITEFVNEMSLSLNDYAPSVTKLDEQMNDNTESLDGEYVNDWMASAISVNNALTHSPIAAEIIADDEVSSVSLKISSPMSPESVAASEASDLGHLSEIEKDGRKNVLYFDDNISETSEYRSDALERINGNYENGQASPEIGTFVGMRSRTMDRMGSSQSLFSPTRSLALEDDDEDDDLFSNPERDFRDDFILEWARENKNDILQIVCAYHALPIPPQGKEILFQPLEHLQAIEYVRPPVSAFGLDKSYLSSFEPSEVDAKLAAAEEAFALSVWTTATICRVLSLDSILAVLAGVLLEKQVVVISPNLGVLSAVVLSIVPLIRPFQWQSLFLPVISVTSIAAALSEILVLPMRMLDFLDAPVPFLVGVQHKPNELKMKASNLVQVNLLKNQAEAATQFLTVMRQYLESLCANLRSHTITSVQSNHDRVSLLLKDSFIDSFPSKEQAFIKLFVDTQLFSVLSDSRLSSFENEH
ncbi:DENN domain-containing 5B [Gossypium arboreum]|uniref:DENN domain-containing 5B n=1 Tax=Gossypium arboreum TaxID=29729 RepID=A0A0B0PGR3_GOSAR|nr:DENN domain-containing 5B [Gossypium arboreum]